MAITTVILVHGAWHGAWCWQPLIPELLQRRLAPFTLDLPAHGVNARFPEGWGDDAARFAVSPSPTSGVTLDDYADAVLEVVDAAQRERIRSAFAHDVDATQFAAMNHLLTPDVPAAPVATPTVATHQRWGRVPRAYIRCSGDRAVMPALQDRFVREADAWTPENPTRVTTLAASHSPFLSMPGKLAQALADLAN